MGDVLVSGGTNVNVTVESIEATVSVVAQPVLSDPVLNVETLNVVVNVQVQPAGSEAVLVEGGTAPTFTIITPEAEAALAEIEAARDAALVAQAAAANAAASASAAAAAVLDWAETWETFAQNLRGLPATIMRDGDGAISSVAYALPAGGQIVKTLLRDGGALTQIVLSGDLPEGVVTTKTLLRDGGGSITGWTYGSA